MPSIQTRFLQGLLALTIAGAINWGSIGLFNFNIVAALLEGSSHQSHMGTASRLVFGLVGAAGVGLLAVLPDMNRSMGTR